jgi:hypothetical protein
MAIIAINDDPLTITPNSLRYSMELDYLRGNMSGTALLQRAQHNADGTWIDDPRPGSSLRVAFPTDAGMTAAIQGLLAIIPGVLQVLGIDGTISDTRLHIRSKVNESSVLVVSLVVQARCNNAWTLRFIPDVIAFVTANPTLAPSVLAAWDAMDVALNTANQANQWL